MDSTGELKFLISSVSKMSGARIQESAGAENRPTNENARRNDTSDIPNSELDHGADVGESETPRIAIL